MYDDRLYAFDIALGTYLLGSNLAQRTATGDKRDTMQRGLRRKASLIHEAFPELSGGLSTGEAVSLETLGGLLGQNVSEDRSLTFVISALLRVGPKQHLDLTS